VLCFWQGLSVGRTKIENRKYPRVKICNTISYIGSDEDGTILEQCLGVVLDVSQSGLLMESIQEVKSTNLSLMASTQKKVWLKLREKLHTAVWLSSENSKRG